MMIHVQKNIRQASSLSRLLYVGPDLYPSNPSLLPQLKPYKHDSEKRRQESD